MKKAKPIESLADLAILSSAQVQRLTNLGHTQLWKLEQSGEFPKRIRLSALRVGWKSCDVREWILSRPTGGAYFNCAANTARRKKSDG
jgi:prophage regulatory protein